MERVTGYSDRSQATVGVADVEVFPAARRISWGAVFGGVVLALAINLLLSLLGVGIGLTTIDPQAAGGEGSPAASSLGIGAAVWWVVSMLAAMFVAGYTASRLAGVFQKGDGILHGLIAWAFTLLLTFYLLTTAIGGLVGGAFSTLSSAASGATQAAPQAQQLARAAGIDANTVTQGIDGMIAQAAPNATPEQVAEARRQLTDLAPQVVRGGTSADEARTRAEQIMSQTLGIPPEQARAQVEQGWQQVKTETAQAADQTANVAASAAIWGFVALLLGAVAAAFGGATGARGRTTDAHDHLVRAGTY
jgi:hypothetical protein